MNHGVGTPVREELRTFRLPLNLGWSCGQIHGFLNPVSCREPDQVVLDRDLRLPTNEKLWTAIDPTRIMDFRGELLR
jgi:hypothetical protein